MSAVVAGLVTGLSLIVAIGAQNAFVLRQGLRRAHVGTVVALCSASDALLIGVGVSGVGVLVQQHPAVLVLARWAGAAYLLCYGARSLWNTRRPQALHAASQQAGGRWAVAATTLALTYLNPHVYLDTVLLLGSVAHHYGPLRWWFAAGAALGSLAWFTTLGLGARAASRVLGRPAVWRVLDLVVGVVMIVLALRLLLG